MEKKSNLMKFSIDDIRSWAPCCDLNRYLREDWAGTVIDILEHNEIPPQDKLWVVCHESLIDGRTLRLFAAWCARQVQHLTTDERSVAALNTAERYANGQATDGELDAACAAARDAARAASWAVARAAIWAASWAAARDTSWDAARDTSWDAARDAACAAASAATSDAAWDAARAAQVVKLTEMVKESCEER